ncbi:hypothetical protein B0E51_17855 [Rhodanobacter sp. C05]|nr:hypothetical protein B0E51_17855 [Rhodanobacter sp. C05]
MYVGLWIVLALAIGSLLGSQNLHRYYALDSQGIKTSGTVIALEPEDHQGVRYSYQVAGNTYKGVGTVGSGNPKFGSLEVGTSVLVYYVGSDPGISELGEPGPRLQNEIESVLMAALTAPIFLLGIFAQGGRSKS